MPGDFTRAAIDIIRSIPRGRVLTYGDVAMLAGNPGAARRISWILNSASEKYNLAWHRIINSRGGISLDGEGAELQRQLLEAEGILFNEQGCLDLNIYRWKPD